jgi:hypothetical protein
MFLERQTCETNTVMDFAERAARTEEVFRNVNEHIEKAADRHGRDVPLRFHCECGQASCFETIDLMPDSYERGSATRYRFIVLDGHEEREIERIVEQHDGWLVVEKLGDAREQIDRERSDGD